ncbi:MAG: hypothetical protein Q9163_001446 [Psora crenata]
MSRDHGTPPDDLNPVNMLKDVIVVSPKTRQNRHQLPRPVTPSAPSQSSRAEGSINRKQQRLPGADKAPDANPSVASTPDEAGHRMQKGPPIAQTASVAIASTYSGEPAPERRQEPPPPAEAPSPDPPPERTCPLPQQTDPGPQETHVYTHPSIPRKRPASISSISTRSFRAVKRRLSVLWLQVKKLEKWKYEEERAAQRREEEKTRRTRMEERAEQEHLMREARRRYHHRRRSEVTIRRAGEQQGRRSQRYRADSRWARERGF